MKSFQIIWSALWKKVMLFDYNIYYTTTTKWDEPRVFLPPLYYRLFGSNLITLTRPPSRTWRLMRSNLRLRIKACFYWLRRRYNAKVKALSATIAQYGLWDSSAPSRYVHCFTKNKAKLFQVSNLFHGPIYFPARFW